MKVLYICSGNSKEDYKISNVFVYELQNAIQRKGITIEVFLVKGRGVFGYLSNLRKYWKLLACEKFDLIHAFYGFSGIFAVLHITRTPVVVSFIGSDVCIRRNRLLSGLAMLLCTHSIFVSKNLYLLLKPRKNFSIIPFGVDLSVFKPLPSNIGNVKRTGNYKYRILFSSSFDRPEKNYTLAKKAIELLNFEIELIELNRGYTREEISHLFNTVDLFLMTSLHEGSPQTIKEAMACNCPIVSTDVGDVKSIIGNTQGCYICSFDPQDVAKKIRLAIEFGKRTNGRDRILQLDNDKIAEKISAVYNDILINRK